MIGKFELLLNIEGAYNADFHEKFEINATYQIQGFDNHGDDFGRRFHFGFVPKLRLLSYQSAGK